MKRKTFVTTFLRGLETTGREDGLELPAWVHFQNTRVGDGSASPRAGIQRIYKFAPTNTCYSFSGSSQYFDVPLDTRVHDLGRYWTFEMLFRPTSVAGTQFLLAWATTSPLKIYMSGTTLYANLYEDDSTPTEVSTSFTVAADTTYALQVTRDGDTLYANLNGAEKTAAITADTDSDVPSGSMAIAYDGSANYFTGYIDYMRMLDVVWRDGVGAGLTNLWRRFPDPRAKYVLWDYVFQEISGIALEDRSRWENHGIVGGSPTTASALSLNDATVRMMHERVDWDGKAYIDVQAGRTTYAVEVGR